MKIGIVIYNIRHNESNFFKKSAKNKATFLKLSSKIETPNQNIEPDTLLYFYFPYSGQDHRAFTLRPISKKVAEILPRV